MSWINSGRFSGLALRVYGKLLAAGLLLALLAGCSGLGGEPRVIATIPPATPAPTDVPDAGFPQQPPDLRLGGQIFAARCAACHGEGGRGDGPLAASGQLVEAPRDFTDPATAGDQTPAEWFGTITNGRLDKLMPPWKDSLSEAERWAVALYTYTLSYQPETLERGEALFEADSGFDQTMLANPARMVNLSDADLAAGIGAGLDDEERRAVAAYVRSLTVANAEVIASSVISPAATPEIEAASEAGSLPGTVSGVVTNGTAGGGLPPDQVVLLRIFDLQGGENVLETTVQPDGRFLFEDVPIRAPQDYIVTASYQGRVFGNGMGIDDLSNLNLELPLTIYEPTDDDTVITITGWFTQIVATSSSLEVVQIIRFSNTSDRVYSVEKTGEDEPFTSVRVRLPEGITDLRFADNRPRFIFTDNPPAIADTVSVLPGQQHTVHVIYSLPYAGSVNIEQPVLYAFDGAFDVLLRPETVSLNSEQLASRGAQEINNRLYQIYGAGLTLSPEDAVRYSLSGAGAVDGGATGAPQPDNTLAIVLMVVGLAAVVAGVGLFLRDRMTARQDDGNQRQQMRDAFLEQIIQLDATHEAGGIDDEAYHKLRAGLKAKLAELMDEE